MRYMKSFKCTKPLSMHKHKDEYLKPDYVYIKIDDPNHVGLIPGMRVFKGQTLGIMEKPYRLPIISTVSGIFHEVITEIGTGNKYLKIENDYLEKYEKKIGYKKNIANYNKEDFIKLLYDCAVVGEGGAGYPTYLKYSTETPIKCLVVNAIECEPNLTTDFATMVMHAENIIDTIDAILNITGIEQAVIAINSEYVDAIDKLNEYLGSYPEITLRPINVKYPLGQSRLLVEQITGELYPKHASDVGVIVNNVTTIYNIYRVLKYRRPVTEKIITIAGDLIEKPRNVLIKIGMLASGLGLSNNGGQIIVDGPLNGRGKDDFNFVIEKTTLAVMIVSRLDKPTTPCINCGKCELECPLKIKVVVAKRALSQKKTQYLKKCGVLDCIGCGLCSYACPANINLREIVLRAKGVLKNEQ